MKPSEAAEILEGVEEFRGNLPEDGLLVEEAVSMAISALKKQEQTKEAIPHRNYQYLSDYWCECGWHLGKKGDVKFCADCGRRIKWD